jgi:hypothetical protein
MAEEKDVNNDIGVEELRDRLDALWEKHLVLLDSYHQAQQQIARYFSTGFFDLAQATFKSTTRVRYGQEYYDDRMQATTRFEASVDKQDTPRLALIVNDTPSSSTKPANKDPTSTEKPPDSNTETSDQGQEAKSEEQGSENKSEEQGSENKSEDKEKAHNKVRDPLHWYGILVPPSLRSSQKSFISAIHNPVIDAANSAQALHRIDMDIRKLRKEIKKAEKKRVV